MSDILIKVTRERYEEVVSVDDDMHLFELSDRAAYDYMVQFVIGDDGQYVSPEAARALFKQVPRKELGKYITAFVLAIRDAYVPKANGAGSDEP